MDQVTFGDVKKEIVDVGIAIELFGAAEAFCSEYHNRLRELGDQIMIDCRCETVEQVMAVPGDTVLPEATAELFNQLKGWLRKTILPEH